MPRLFIFLGSVYLTIQLCSVVFIKNPHAQPLKEEPVIESPFSPEQAVTLNQILRSPLFYALWFTFLFNDQAIIAITGLYKAFGLQYWSDDKSLTLIGSLGSISNALGRLGWGFLADRMEYRVSLRLNKFLRFTVTSLNIPF